MRRRPRHVLALVAVLALVLPGNSYGEAEIQELQQTNTVRSSGSHSLLVKLPESITIPYLDEAWWAQWLDIETTGAYAGLMIQESPHAGTRQALFWGEISPSNNCSAVVESCRPVSLLWWKVDFGGRTEPPRTMTLRPGTYLMYVIAEPGSDAVVRFSLPLAAGTAELMASEPVEVTTELQTASAPAFAQLRGSHRGSLAGEGLVYGRLWWTPTLDSEGPNNPTPTQSGLNLGATSQCIHPSDGRSDPVGTCGMTPGSQSDNDSGLFLFTTDLRAEGNTGEWNHAFSVASAAPDAQVGAFTFWLTYRS